MARGRRFGALFGAVALCALGAATTSACTAPDELRGLPSPKLAGSGGSGGGSSSGDLFDDAGMPDGPPALDASGLCGNQLHKIVTHPPNLYFVFDASGSMSSQAGGGYTRYDLVEHAALMMITTLGTLINVGAAVFPKNATAEKPCAIGGEVFKISPGDPVAPTAGPTTLGFAAATSLEPYGGTPTAATLAALEPGLVAQKGKTVVLLATDGGPNCNAHATCNAQQCISNIESVCPKAPANCCALGGVDGPEGCLDEAGTVAAVASLAKAGIPVYVIGIPGSQLYSNVLDAMAIAGGAPQPGSPSYYKVDDLGNLEDVFQSIAAVVISCDFALADTPPDPGKTNVYFDQDVVLQDPNNGWIWKSPTEIELVGKACQLLKNGGVKQVQIVSGCPTEQPK